MNKLRNKLLLISSLLACYFLRLNSVLHLNRNLPGNSRVKIAGRVSQQPVLKDTKQIIRLSQFTIITSRFPGYFYGQELVVIGKLEKRVINQFEVEFALNYPAIQVVKEENSLINQINLQRFLLNLRGRIESRFSEFLNEPQASLLSGVLLGSKKQLPEKFTQSLRKTGTIHIVVASGYNISVIGGFLIVVLVRFFKRRLALILAFLGVIIYVLMVGLEPAVVRAGIMGSLTYLAQFFGREKSATRALVFAAVLMLLISPLILFDIGFQLSFLATAGILWLSPLLQKRRFFKLPLVGDNFAVTLSAQLATLPVMLANFGQVSWFSPLVNVLVSPVVPLIMSLGGLVAVTGLISRPLGRLFAWLTWVPLTYFVKIVAGLGN